jgi:hypothetical protein
VAAQYEKGPPDSTPGPQAQGLGRKRGPFSIPEALSSGVRVHSELTFQLPEESHILTSVVTGTQYRHPGSISEVQTRNGMNAIIYLSLPMLEM